MNAKMLTLNHSVEFSFASDRSILIKVCDDISPECNNEIIKIFSVLQSTSIEGIQSIHPAYNSILVAFDPTIIFPFKMMEDLKKLVQEKPLNIEYETNTINIPVCFDEEFAPDLNEVAQLNKLTINEVIAFHTRPNYLVYFLGFSPGFPYLGGMLTEISTPRLKTPRLKVPEGSVAIGGKQTGIYPVESPGGWRLIGRTPLKLFSPHKKPPTLLRMGDRVNFFAISKNEFEQIKSKQE